MKKLLLRLANWLAKIASNNVKLSQIDAEILCLRHGHLWSSSFKPGEEINKPIKDRVYCRRCNKIYSETVYKK